MRYLFTTFEGGGHVPPALLVARKLRDNGHEVRFVSDEANRSQAQDAGLDFQPWTTAPNRLALGAADDPLRDWRVRWPPNVVREICRSVISGPAGAYARDTAEQIELFKPDAVVSNELLFGAMIAAEAAGAPLALLTSNIWCYPTREDVPPFGPGFPPPRSRFEQERERTVRRLIRGWYSAGLKDLNRAREAMRMAPLAAALDQLAAVDLVLLGTSPAFDYGASDAAAPFRYVGPLGQRPHWAQGSAGLEAMDHDVPNVLISFSITHQGQAATVARCVRAVSALSVRAVLTLGPALEGLRLPRAANVRVLEQADHDELVPQMQAVICHGGHGTLIRCLQHGVPVVCIPSGRDQPENAARLAWAGAGLRLPRRASVGRIRQALAAVLGDPAYGRQAGRLGDMLRVEADGGSTAARALEELAAQRSRICRTAPAAVSSNLAAVQDGGPNRPRASFENP